MGRGQKDAPNQGSMDWYGYGVYIQKMGSREVGDKKPDRLIWIVVARMREM